MTFNTNHTILEPRSAIKCYKDSVASVCLNYQPWPSCSKLNEVVSLCDVKITILKVWRIH